MDEEKQSWITAAELANRLGTSRAKITQVRKSGFFTCRIKNGTANTSRVIYEFPWPKVAKQYEDWMAETRHKTKSAKELNFDLTDINYKDLKSWEKVVLALEQGAKNAPDMATAYMKAIEQQAKTRLNQIKAMKEEGTVLDRGEVEEWAFNVSKSNRDIWLNWPQVVATRMAEELSVEPKKLHDVLKKYVIKQLGRNAQMPETFKDTGEDE